MGYQILIPSVGVSCARDVSEKMLKKLEIERRKRLQKLLETFYRRDFVLGIFFLPLIIIGICLAAADAGGTQ